MLNDRDGKSLVETETAIRALLDSVVHNDWATSQTSWGIDWLLTKNPDGVWKASKLLSGAYGNQPRPTRTSGAKPQAPQNPPHEPPPPPAVVKVPLTIPTEIVREPWHLGRKDWAGLAALPVKSLPIAAGETRHPLEWLTLDTWLAAPERRFVEWFRRQLSHSAPVFRPSQSDLLYCLAAMWDSMGRAESIRISRFAELAAHQTIDNWRAIGRHVNKLVPHLPAIIKKSEPGVRKMRIGEKVHEYDVL